MQIDVTQPIRDLDGKPTEQTLRRVIEDVCVLQIKGDDALDSKSKLDLFAIALKVRAEDRPDLRAEEIVLLKERIGLAYHTLVVGRAFAMLDPAPAAA